jgi:hypothetical protein
VTLCSQAKSSSFWILLLWVFHRRKACHTREPCLQLAVCERIHADGFKDRSGGAPANNGLVFKAIRGRDGCTRHFGCGRYENLSGAISWLTFSRAEQPT